MVYKVTLIPRTSWGMDLEAVVFSFASDLLPSDIDFSSDFLVNRILLDFLHVCGYQVTDFIISTVERYDV